MKNRNKKQEFIAIQFYVLILVLLTTFLSFNLVHRREVLTNGRGQDLYVCPHNKIQLTQEANLSTSEKIERLRAITRDYPLDLGIMKKLRETEREAYYQGHPQLEREILNLNRDVLRETKNQNYDKIVKTLHLLQSKLPNRPEFEALRLSYREAELTNSLKFASLTMQKKILIQKEQLLEPLERMLQFKKSEEPLSIIETAQAHQNAFLENTRFMQIYWETLSSLSPNEFIPLGFENRLRSVEPTLLSGVSFQLDGGETLEVEKLYPFSTYEIGKNVVLRSHFASTEDGVQEQAYAFMLLDKDHLLLKKKNYEKSLPKTSTELYNYLRFETMVKARHFTEFIQNDIFNILLSYPTVEKFSPHNRLFFHLSLMSYITFFAVNIDLFFFLFYLGYFRSERGMKLIHFIFYSLLVVLCYVASFYTLSSLLLFFLGDFLYFYLFVLLSLILLFAFTTKLYSLTNPKTKEKENYELFRDITQR